MRWSPKAFSSASYAAKPSPSLLRFDTIVTASPSIELARIPYILLRVVWSPPLLNSALQLCTYSWARNHTFQRSQPSLPLSRGPFVVTSVVVELTLDPNDPSRLVPLIDDESPMMKVDEVLEGYYLEPVTCGVRAMALASNTRSVSQQRMFTK